MGQVTIRPNGTVSNSASIVGGDGTAHGVTSDDTDASYLSEGFGSVADLDLDDPAIPAGAAVRQVRERVRHRIDGAGSYNDLESKLRLGFPNEHSREIRVQQTSFFESSGPWRTSKPGGGAWTVSDVQDVRWAGYINSQSGPSALHIAEIYVDVDYNERPVGDLTAPTGTFNDQSDPDAAWTYSDPEGDVQTHYRIVVEEGDTSAAGAPGTGTTVYDSGEVASAATTASLPALDNGTYTVWLRVRQPDVSGAAHRSAWDASVYTLNVSPPAVPTLTAVADPQAGSIDLEADSESPAGLEAETYDLQFSDDAGTTWGYVRGGEQVAPDSGVVDTPVTLADHEPPPNTQRLYRARAGRQTAEGRVVSAWSTSVGETLPVDRWWLKDPTDPSRSISLRGHDAEALQVEHAAGDGVHEPIEGGTIVVSGARAGERVACRFGFRTRAAWEAFRALVDNPTTLQLVDPGVGSWYGRVVRPVREERNLFDHDDPMRVATFTFVQTSKP